MSYPALLPLTKNKVQRPLPPTRDIFQEGNALFLQSLIHIRTKRHSGGLLLVRYQYEPC